MEKYKYSERGSCPTTAPFAFHKYEYKNGEKLLLQEGSQTSFETEISESIILGVAAYNDHGESEVIPRIAVVEKEKPKPIQGYSHTVTKTVTTTTTTETVEVE